VVSGTRDAAPVVLRDVEVEGRRVDVRLVGGSVAEIGPRLIVPLGEDEVDGGGGVLLPGLHDHHVHLLAMAARRVGVDLDPLLDASAADAAIRAAAIRAAAADLARGTRARGQEKRTVSGSEDLARGTRAGGQEKRTVSGEGARWVRVAGYDEHRHGAMGRARLDALAPGVAVRVQHRSGLAWVLSSAALTEVGLDGTDPGPDGVERGPDGRPTGWLHRLDAWLGERVPRTEVADGLARVGHDLAALGITGVTDATHALGRERAALLRAAVDEGALPQRVVVLGLDDPSLVEGWARLGPAKLLADEALGLDPGGLAGRVAEHHAVGRAVAIHAVTRAENVATVAALVEAGTVPGDRIEHGSVLPPDLDPLLVDGGVTVVVQPSLVAERGDHHLAEVDPDDLPLLHRHASLLAAGVRVGVGSDAPVTSVDPWAGLVAASSRRAPSGAVVGPLEAVPPAVALGWYLADPSDPGGPPRRISVGAPADLCLLDAPLADVLAEPSGERVRATWVGGRLVGG
jgi:predicted amidohydrolase YtcJ